MLSKGKRCFIQIGTDFPQKCFVLLSGRIRDWYINFRWEENLAWVISGKLRSHVQIILAFPKCSEGWFSACFKICNDCIWDLGDRTSFQGEPPFRVCSKRSWARILFGINRRAITKRFLQQPKSRNGTVPLHVHCRLGLKNYSCRKWHVQSRILLRCKRARAIGTLAFVVNATRALARLRVDLNTR